jgi:hypothetical protein
MMDPEKNTQVLKAFKKHDERALTRIWEELVEAHEYCSRATALKYGSALVEGYLRGHGVRIGLSTLKENLPLATTIMTGMAWHFFNREHRDIWYPRLSTLFPDVEAATQTMKNQMENQKWQDR